MDTTVTIEDVADGKGQSMVSKNILIVEDGKTCAMKTKMVVELLGYTVSGIEASGEQAIEKAVETRPDLILMDIILDGKMDGIKAAKEIRKRIDIPVIYLTGISNADMIKKVKETEPFGYVMKPFQERELETVIELAFYKHKMEKKLRFLKKALETTNMGVTISNLDGKIIYSNPADAKMHGYSQEELTGKDVRIFSPPEMHRHISIDQLLKTKDKRRDSVNIKKDGSLFPVHLISDVETDSCGDAVALVTTCEDITDRKETEKELKETLRKIETTQVASLNIMEDIERQKKELDISLGEKEKLNKELKDFAYIVSHDLKAPLRAISSLAHWISEDYTEKLDKNGKDQLNLLRQRTSHMNNLIEGILRYSRIGRMKVETVSIDSRKAVEETIVSIAPPENIIFDIKEELPRIKGDPIQIGQVFQNLIENAVKVMDKPEGLVEVGYRDLDDCHEFYVKDNGPGIEERHFKRIFQIFQGLRKDKDSTGIGLSIVKKIVEQNGGVVSVESEVGKGSTFSFTLPKEIWKGGF